MELRALETAGFLSVPGIFTSDDTGTTGDTGGTKTDKDIPMDDDDDEE